VPTDSQLAAAPVHAVGDPGTALAAQLGERERVVLHVGGDDALREKEKEVGLREGTAGGAKGEHWSLTSRSARWRGRFSGDRVDRGSEKNDDAKRERERLGRG